MAIRVLIINRQLAFSVALKQSLERTGAFEVHPFTTADAATEYLQTHPQDVVLLDFNSVAPGGAAVVDALRRLQPGIAIVVSPRQNDDVLAALSLQEHIDPPFTTRDIVPLLNRAVEAASNYDSGSVASPTSTRPGEIRDEELRPYMYSTDIFQQRQESSQSEEDAEARLRPGEIDPAQLGPRTDVFNEPSETTPDNESIRALREYRTDDLPSPTTDTLHVELTDDNAPASRRYVANQYPKVAGEDAENPGSLSEQELLNFAVNREEFGEHRDSQNQAWAQPDEPDLFRAGTDVLKSGDQGEPLSAQDNAVSTWEPLTRDDMPGRFRPRESDGEVSFEFEQDEDEEPAETPVNLEFENTGSIEDWLVEAAQNAESPDTNDTSYRPKTVTDFLEARASEIESQGSSGSGAKDEEHAWDFPDDENWSAEGEPVRDPERVALSRKRTDPLPPSVHSQLSEDDVLAQQLEVDSLIRDSISALDANAVDPGQIEVSFDSSGSEDGFEPPVLPEDIVASWEQSPTEDAGASAAEPNPAGETRLFDKDDGVARLEALADEIRHTRATAKLRQEPLKTNIDETFQKLAAEEPPMPEAIDSDSGTVGDLYAGVHDPAFQNVLQILRGEEEVVADVPPPEMIISDAASEGPVITQAEIEEIFTSFSRRDRPRDEYGFDESQSDADSEHPAHLILETALDESTPADAFSLDELITSIERQLEIRKPSVRPLPSWAQEQPALGDDLYVREPDFLAGVIADVDALPDLEDEDVFGDATTYAGEAFETGSNAETELLRRDNYPSSLPEMDWLLEPPVAEDDTDGVTKPIEATAVPQQPDDALLRIEDEEPEFSTEFERLAAFNLDADEREQTPAMGLPAIQDPYIAQVALSLTQISLEELAAAVLTQANEIIAHAGRMGRSDIEEIRKTIEDQWDTGTDQANIRFITLPSSGKDYLLYSRRTVNDLTLSLLFPGSTPLRDIRKQGKRLLDALMAVPEPEGYEDDTENDSILTAASQSDVRNMYTYIWLLRDPDMQLNEMVASAIESGLKVQLEERNWQILNLEVRTECVYLLADVPGEVPPYEVIRDLKRRSAEIARKQNPIFGKHDVWADSYLIVTPGRALDEDEIQEFISFERIT